MGGLLRIVLLSFALLCSGIAVARDQGETVWIPMLDKGIFGNKEIRLEATLYRPDGDGPFPVVVFNHGSTGPGKIPATQTRNPAGFGSYLEQRGIALLVPMRRGRGKSEGSYSEPYECSLHQSKSGIEYASEALDAVFVYLRAQKWADADKVALAGESRGGILSVIYAADRPRVARGVINFVGGWMGDRCNQQAGTDINATLFQEAGAQSKIPNLFLYANNDSVYSSTSIEKYPEAFRVGGGDVEFKLYTVDPGANGHLLFPRFWKVWTSDFDGFLKRIGVWDGVMK